MPAARTIRKHGPIQPIVTLASIPKFDHTNLLGHTVLLSGRLLMTGNLDLVSRPGYRVRPNLSQRNARSSANPRVVPRLRTVAGRSAACPLLTVRPGDLLGWAGLGRSPVYALLSGSPGRGVVLLRNSGRDPPAAADRDSLLVGPRPDVAAALPA